MVRHRDASMPEQVTKVRVFLASPGDVAAERERLVRVVDGLNRTLGQDKGAILGSSAGRLMLGQDSGTMLRT